MELEEINIFLTTVEEIKLFYFMNSKFLITKEVLKNFSNQHFAVTKRFKYKTKNQIFFNSDN